MKNQNSQTKKFLILVFILIFPTRLIFAQTETGVKGGILFSDINAPDNNSNVEIEKRDGVVLGAFYKKNNVLGPVGFQAELLYQLKGANFYIEAIGNTSAYNPEETGYLLDDIKSYYRTNEKLHYLSVPLLIDLNAAKFVDIYAGSELGYLISQKTERQKTDELSRFSAGIVMGATLRLCENTHLDFRYSTDFTAFDKLGKGSSVEMKTESFTITIQHTIFIKQNK